MDGIQRFKCSRCGEIYHTQEEALECEGRHIEICGVEPIEYLSKEEGDTKYAERISIKYSDGKTIQYERIITGNKNFNG